MWPADALQSLHERSCAALNCGFACASETVQCGPTAARMMVVRHSASNLRSAERLLHRPFLAVRPSPAATTANLTGSPTSNRSPVVGVLLVVQMPDTGRVRGKDRRSRPQRRERSAGLRLGSSSATAGHRSPRHAPHVGVDRTDRRHHGSPRGDQTPHGGRETCDPFAGFDSLVDEGGGERAREPDLRRLQTRTGALRQWCDSA
jgi:hypothetical protein